MEVRYQCSVADYIEAQNSHQKRYLFYLFVALGSFFFIVGLIQLALSGISQAFPLLILGSLWLGMRFVFRPFWLKRDFRKHPNVSRETVARIDEEGLEHTNEIVRSKTKWIAYTKFRETKNLFILYTGGRTMEVVPKRAFPPPAEAEFRDLLRRQIGDK